MYRLLIFFSGHIGNVHAVVAYAFQIPNGIQDLRYNPLIILRKAPLVDPHHISRQDRFTPVQELLLLLHKRELLCIIMIDHPGCSPVVIQDRIRHLHHQVLALFQCDGRCIQKHIIQLGQLLRSRIFLFLSSQTVADLRHTIRSKQKKETRNQIKCQMHGGDTSPVHHMGQPREMKK